MINLRFVIFFLSNILINTLGQTYFQRFYPELDDKLFTQDVIEIDDEYWLLAYQRDVYNLNNSKLFKIKLNKAGDIISKRHLSEINLYNISYSYKYPCTFLKNGSFSLVEQLQDNDSIFVSVFNQSNDKVFTQLLMIQDESNADIPNFAVHSISDSQFATLEKMGNTKLRLFKKNEKWNQNFENEYNLRTSLNNSPINICSGFGDTLFISGKYQVIKTNLKGDIIWSVYTGLKIINNMVFHNGILALSLTGYNNYENSIMLINNSGEVEWENIIDDIPNIRGPVWELEINFENNILGSIWSGGYISYSKEGVLNEIKKGDVYVNFIKKLSENNLFFAGRYFFAVNKELEKIVNFLDLSTQKEYFTSDKIEILWNYINIDYLDIYYSIDGGMTWINIIKHFPAVESRYYWTPSFENMDEVYFKITEYENKQTFDQSDSAIAIRIYDEHTLFAPNEIAVWLWNNGTSAHDPYTNDSGFYWPGGNYAKISSIFIDGLVWGGKVNGEIRVNGSTFRTGLQPGKIISKDSADNPYQLKYKIFKIRKNWESLPQSNERDRYMFDYFNWPGDLGATFEDLDGDGKFSKGIDQPKFIGDETVFYVANDLDSAKSQFTYGSPPIGLEFQTTIWGYDTNNFLKDVVFKKYKIINKSEDIIEDMFLSYWTDDDLGFAGDDFVGCDTLLNLGYTYNSDNFDDDFYGSAPPAVGHLLLQGPIIDSNPDDSAKISNKWKKGYRNLTMSSFTPGFKNFWFIMDPPMGSYEGTVETYNFMLGLKNDGSQIINPYTNHPTKFPLSGDPYLGYGWYEGLGYPNGPNPGDRRHYINSGPFTMAPGDTQEVVYAIFMARGSDNVQSVAELKKTARLLHEFWGNDIRVSVNEKNTVLPTNFSLLQNYPNPFNPTTTIKYSIPTPTQPSPYQGEGVWQGFVSLVVYDILGREVKTLVNQKQKPGNYEVEFNASSLSSGVYYYKLTYGNPSKDSGQSFSQVKKMIFLK